MTSFIAENVFLAVYILQTGPFKRRGAEKILGLLCFLKKLNKHRFFRTHFPALMAAHSDDFVILAWTVATDEQTERRTDRHLDDG